MTDQGSGGGDWRSVLDDRITDKAWEVAKEHLGIPSAYPGTEAERGMTEIAKAVICAYVVGTMSGLRQVPELTGALDAACAAIDSRFPDGIDAKQFTIDDVFFAVGRVAPDIPADASIGIVGNGADGFEKLVNAISFELGPIAREVAAALPRSDGPSPASASVGAATGGGCLIGMLSFAYAVALGVLARTARLAQQA